MSEPGSVITVGSLKIPALAVGFSVSLVAHIGILATLANIPAGQGEPSAVPPAMEFSQGEPIRVHLVSELPSDLPPPNEISSPESPVQAPPRLPTATAEAELQHRFEKQPVTDKLDRDSQPARAAGPEMDWGALVDAFRSIDWPVFTPITFGTSSARENGVAVKTIEPVVADARAGHRESADSPAIDAKAAAPPVVASTPETAPINQKKQRGIDRGATIIDLPQPVYPRRSIRLEHEGTAIIEITVRANGTGRHVRLRTSSGHKLLDNAAIEAAQSGTFRAALQNGQPIEAVLVVPFEFKLTVEK
ncbi:energy transducer TonB [Planctomycetaceae bacterium AH-315-I19]|nr:energy transducer TonB [Planctomycetaceae bacterium AH-315-I19]